jgi:HTH DNA binding domain
VSRSSRSSRREDGRRRRPPAGPALRAVSAQAEDAVTRAEQLVDLRERYRAALAGSRSRVVEVVDLMIENPILSTYSIQRQLQVTNQGALNLIKQLERRGWISRIGKFGRGGRTFWVADEVFSTLNRPRAENKPPSDSETAADDEKIA